MNINNTCTSNILSTQQNIPQEQPHKVNKFNLINQFHLALKLLIELETPPIDYPSLLTKYRSIFDFGIEQGARADRYCDRC